MPDRVQIIAIIGSLALLLVIFEAIRRRRLREQYALTWLLTGGALLLLSVWRDLLTSLSQIAGIYYPPSVLLLIGAGFVVLILLDFSMVVSDLSAKVTRLTQAHALLEREVMALSQGEQSGIDKTLMELNHCASDVECALSEFGIARPVARERR